MISEDFNVPFPPLKKPAESADFRKRIENTGTAHLSWERVGRPPLTKPDRKKMEEHALWLLDRTRDFIEQCRHSGFALSGAVGELYENVCRIHEYLTRTQRVDEDTGPRPACAMMVAVPISLEALSAIR